VKRIARKSERLLDSRGSKRDNALRTSAPKTAEDTVSLLDSANGG
jgi:hypothetical protein